MNHVSWNIKVEIKELDAVLVIGGGHAMVILFCSLQHQVADSVSGARSDLRCIGLMIACLNIYGDSRSSWPILLHL